MAYNGNSNKNTSKNVKSNSTIKSVAYGVSSTNVKDGYSNWIASRNSQTIKKASNITKKYSDDSSDGHSRWIEERIEKMKDADKDSEALITSIFEKKPILSSSITLGKTNTTVDTKGSIKESAETTKTTTKTTIKTIDEQIATGGVRRNQNNQTNSTNPTNPTNPANQTNPTNPTNTQNASKIFEKTVKDRIDNKVVETVMKKMEKEENRLKLIQNVKEEKEREEQKRKVIIETAKEESMARAEREERMEVEARNLIEVPKIESEGVAEESIELLENEENTAAQDSKEEMTPREYDKYKYGKATIIQSKDSDSSKPTLLHFDWSSGNITEEKTWQSFEENSNLKDWNVVGVLNKDKNNNWDSIVGPKGLTEYVREGVLEGTIDPKNIYIGGYSLAGTGACKAVEALHGMEVELPDGTTTTIEIKGVDFVSGAVKGVVTAEKIQSYLEEGIEVGIYASETDNKNKLSANGRDLIKEFEGTSGFTGATLGHGHNEEFVKEVYENYQITLRPIEKTYDKNQVVAEDTNSMEDVKPVENIEPIEDIKLTERETETPNLEALKEEAKKQKDPYTFLFSKVTAGVITANHYSQIAESIQREEFERLTGKTIEEYLGKDKLSGNAAENCEILGEAIYQVKESMNESIIVEPSITLAEKEASISSYVAGYQLPVTAVTGKNDSVIYSYDSDVISISSSGYVTINRDKYVEKYGRKTVTIPITISLSSGEIKKKFSLKVTNYEYKNVSGTSVAIKEGTQREGAPLIIYIGGQGEMANKLSQQAANPSVYYLNSNKTYEATTLTVKVNKANEAGMREAMDDVMKEVQERVARGEIDPSKISVVSYSYGGYGGQYVTKKINHLEGYQVENLVLLDSVQPDYSSKGNPDLASLQEILSGGTDIKVYGSSHRSPGQYGVWDACRDSIAYYEQGGFDESNGQFSGKVLENPAHNGWTQEQEVIDFLDSIANTHIDTHTNTRENVEANTDVTLSDANGEKLENEEAQKVLEAIRTESRLRAEQAERLLSEEAERKLLEEKAAEEKLLSEIRSAKEAMSSSAYEKYLSNKLERGEISLSQYNAIFSEGKATNYEDTKAMLRESETMQRAFDFVEGNSDVTKVLEDFLANGNFNGLIEEIEKDETFLKDVSNLKACTGLSSDYTLGLVGGLRVKLQSEWDLKSMSAAEAKKKKEKYDEEASAFVTDFIETCAKSGKTDKESAVNVQIGYILLQHMVERKITYGFNKASTNENSRASIDPAIELDCRSIAITPVSLVTGSGNYKETMDNKVYGAMFNVKQMSQINALITSPEEIEMGDYIITDDFGHIETAFYNDTENKRIICVNPSNNQSNFVVISYENGVLQKDGKTYSAYDSENTFRVERTLYEWQEKHPDESARDLVDLARSRESGRPVDPEALKNLITFLEEENCEVTMEVVKENLDKIKN